MFTNCRRCGRKLRTQRSKDLGYGAVCLARINRAVRALSPSQAQLEKAFDALLDGALVAYRSVFRVVSSDGYRTYLTTRSACSCAAGAADRLCWHRVAVTIAKV